MRNVKQWWIEVIHKNGQSRKAMASLAVLVSWEISKQRNASFFLKPFYYSGNACDKNQRRSGIVELSRG
jgi:hypothetical protein